jgi:hypothetical protein
MIRCCGAVVNTGFAILQIRKADWPPRIIAREAARHLSAKEGL